MNNSQIAKILHINKSSVSRILRGSKNYSKYKIERCLFYKNYEINVIESLFKEAEFRSIMKFIISKATSRDSSDHDELIRFASQCLRWHEVLCLEGVKKLDGNIVASLNKEPIDLFCNQLFWESLNVVIKKCKDTTLKYKASVLQDLSTNIRRVMR